jgi:hypothetical protein
VLNAVCVCVCVCMCVSLLDGRIRKGNASERGDAHSKGEKGRGHVHTHAIPRTALKV